MSFSEFVVGVFWWGIFRENQLIEGAHITFFSFIEPSSINSCFGLLRIGFLLRKAREAFSSTQMIIGSSIFI